MMSRNLQEIPVPIECKGGGGGQKVKILMGRPLWMAPKLK